MAFSRNRLRLRARSGTLEMLEMLKVGRPPSATWICFMLTALDKKSCRTSGPRQVSSMRLHQAGSQRDASSLRIPKLCQAAASWSSGRPTDVTISET